MSNSNETPNTQTNNDSIVINENGEVVIKDTELAEQLQELSAEELEAVAGGLKKLALRSDSNGKNCPNCSGATE